MLSALVLASDSHVRVSASPEAMARTLAALVPAAVQGVIKDVTLASLLGADQALYIADHAGCALAEADTPEAVLKAGLALTRGDIILVLRAGYAPEAGFMEEVSDQFERSAIRAPRSAFLRAVSETFLTRLLPALTHVEGVIVRRSDIARSITSLVDLRRQLVAPVAFRCRLRRVV